jgi:chloride channel 3/4/5
MVFLFYLRKKIFLRSNIKWCAYRKNTQWLGKNPIYEVLIVSMVTGTISFFNPYTRKSASSLIKQVFLYKFF